MNRKASTSSSGNAISLDWDSSQGGESMAWKTREANLRIEDATGMGVLEGPTMSVRSMSVAGGAGTGSFIPGGEEGDIVKVVRWW